VCECVEVSFDEIPLAVERKVVSGNWRPRFSFWADYGTPFA
jgi:hypothetical protein